MAVRSQSMRSDVSTAARPIRTAFLHSSDEGPESASSAMQVLYRCTVERELTPDKEGARCNRQCHCPSTGPAAANCGSCPLRRVDVVCFCRSAPPSINISAAHKYISINIYAPVMVAPPIGLLSQKTCRDQIHCRIARLHKLCCAIDQHLPAIPPRAKKLYLPGTYSLRSARTAYRFPPSSTAQRADMTSGV